MFFMKCLAESAGAAANFEQGAAADWLEYGFEQ
jgi:hypothetical protein